MRRMICLIAAVVSVSNPTCAADSGRDFSGKWVFSPEASRVGDLPGPEPFLTVNQDASAIRCASEIAGIPAEWSFALNGAESKYRLGSETRNSAVKWEGSALLINTLVCGPRNYVIMDRWRLSADGACQIVTGQAMRDQRQPEGGRGIAKSGRTAETIIQIPGRRGVGQEVHLRP